VVASSAPRLPFFLAKKFHKYGNTNPVNTHRGTENNSQNLPAISVLFPFGVGQS
jgi:hypothetical protein